MSNKSCSASPSLASTSARTASLLAHEPLCRLEAAYGGDPGIDALIRVAKINSELLERCLLESRSVLCGNMIARDRVWLLLRSAAGIPVFEVPQHILKPIGGEPTVMHRDAVLDLVTGVGRSANSPAEAGAMVTALGGLLDSLFLLDHAAKAQQRGDFETIRTISAAGRAASWAAANNPPPQNIRDGQWKDREPLVTGAVVVGRSVLASLSNWNTKWGCLAVVASSEIDLMNGIYEIQSISSQAACAGETITISGTGFGAEGRVYFPTSDWTFNKFAGDPGLLVGIPALSWTDTRIDVVVPPWAVDGDLHLNAFHTVTSGCRIRDIYRPGNPHPFTGGVASIFEHDFKDLNDPSHSLPPLTFAQRDNVVVSWRASVGTVRVSVNMLQKSDGFVQLDPPKPLLDPPVDVPGGGPLWQSTIVRIPEIGGDFAHAQFVLAPAGNCGQMDPLTVDFRIPGGLG